MNRLHDTFNDTHPPRRQPLYYQHSRGVILLLKRVSWAPLVSRAASLALRTLPIRSTTAPTTTLAGES